MTHYEKRYAMDSAEGRDAALRDLEDWLGKERFALVTQAIKSGEIETMEKLRLVLSFVGVTGAPVTALGERHGLYE